MEYCCPFASLISAFYSLPSFTEMRKDRHLQFFSLLDWDLPYISVNIVHTRTPPDMLKEVDEDI